MNTDKAPSLVPYLPIRALTKRELNAFSPGGQDRRTFLQTCAVLFCRHNLKAVKAQSRRKVMAVEARPAAIVGNSHDLVVP
jgi:hypothetical protein